MITNPTKEPEYGPLIVQTTTIIQANCKINDKSLGEKKTSEILILIIYTNLRNDLKSLICYCDFLIIQLMRVVNLRTTFIQYVIFVIVNSTIGCNILILPVKIITNNASQVEMGPFRLNEFTSQLLITFLWLKNFI